MLAPQGIVVIGTESRFESNETGQNRILKFIGFLIFSQILSILKNILQSSIFWRYFVFIAGIAQW